MKNFLLIILFFLGLSISAQDGYWYHSKWIDLKPVDNVLTQEKGNLESNNNTKQSIINSANEVINKKKLTSSYIVNLRVTQQGDTVVVLPRIFAKIEQDYVAKLICKTFKNRLRLVSSTSDNIYKFNCEVVCDKEVLKIVDDIARITGVEWCQPNMLAPIRYNNAFYPQQYYLKNTGQNGGTPGVDINVEAAWQKVTGSPLITVAVIDRGVDITHEDLVPNVLTGYTVGSSNGNGAPITSDTIHDIAHGTACAGIIGAIDNEIGIRGVASGVKILPVSFGSGGVDDEVIAEAINWAYPRADILSCSWTYGVQEELIDNAINKACTLGRNGKGCVVVFGSGNTSNPLYRYIQYPGYLANVVTVGAVDNNDVVRVYSCRGDSLDLVAPCGNVEGQGDMVTTDISGAYGYTTTNYCNTFGGTSAACAEVAGVAALMLSINPTLTQHRVRDILRETATSATNWTAAYGYGRVDAGAAVNKAKTELPAFTTSKTYNGENEMTVTVSAANNNFSYYFTTEWTVLAGNMTISATGSNYCTLTKSTSGLPTGVVMMKVKFGDKVLYTTVVGLNISNVAKYRQEACTYYGVGHPAIPLTVINSGGQAHVHQGCRVYLYNEAFGLYQHYGNISHSGVTPDDWYVGNNNVQFSLPLGSGGIPFGVQVRDDSGTLKYQYIFFSYSGNGNSSLRVNAISSSEYEISLCEDEDNQIVSRSNDDALIAYENSEQTWRLEIYNTWDASKVYDQEIFGDKAILDTSGWRVGTYAIRAIRGDQVYTEKMLVK